MATSKIQVSEGVGKNVATFPIFEDAVTKEIQRIALVTSLGAEVTDASGRLPATLATILSALNDKVIAYPPGTQVQALTVSGAVFNATGVTLQLAGYIVSSLTGSPTVQIYDNPTAASGNILVPTFIPTKVGEFVSLGNINAAQGIYFSISGTITITAVFYILA